MDVTEASMRDLQGSLWSLLSHQHRLCVKSVLYHYTPFEAAAIISILLFLASTL